MTNEQEKIGGFVWSLKEYWSGRLHQQEGIFIPSNILAGNFAQMIVILFLIVFTINLSIQEWEELEADGDVDDDFTLMVNSYLPTREQILISINVGMACGLASTIKIFCAYILSTISTTLKFRSGQIPSLRDPRTFQQFRFAQDTTAAIFGSVFWGSFYTAFAVAVIIGLIVFFSMWPLTSPFMFGLYATLLGLLITVTIKILFMMFFVRRRWFAGFYRIKPLNANFINGTFCIAKVAADYIYAHIASLTSLLILRQFSFYCSLHGSLERCSRYWFYAGKNAYARVGNCYQCR